MGRDAMGVVEMGGGRAGRGGDGREESGDRGGWEQ